MKIIECGECGTYYNTEECYYYQYAPDGYTYKCPEKHDLVETEIVYMGEALEELQTLSRMIRKRDKTIRYLEQKILKLEVANEI